MGISERLQEERKRLGLTQEVAAAKLGTTKRSVINWEGGAAMPGAEALSSYAEAGADVLYILTGQEAAPRASLTADEIELLNMYRHAPFAAKAAARGALEGALTALKNESTAPAVRIGQMTNKAAGGVQIGHAGGNVTVKRR